MAITGRPYVLAQSGVTEVRRQQRYWRAVPERKGFSTRIGHFGQENSRSFRDTTQLILTHTRVSVSLRNAVQQYCCIPKPIVLNPLLRKCEFLIYTVPEIGTPLETAEDDIYDRAQFGLRKNRTRDR